MSNPDEQKYQRPTWDEYFMEVVNAISKRATCSRGRSGCVIAKNNHILVTGYVGSPIGLPHCDEVGHMLHDVVDENGKISKHCVRTIHAEQNAILQAALHGVSTEGATIYVKFVPCFVCAKMIINAGIKRVVSERRYHADELTRKIFKEAQVELVILKDEVERYPEQ